MVYARRNVNGVGTTSPQPNHSYQGTPRTHASGQGLIEGRRYAKVPWLVGPMDAFEDAP